MSPDLAIFALAAVMVLVSSLSGRIERTPLTVPLLLVIIGWAGSSVFDITLPLDEGGALLLLEVTLALVLFSDATRIDLAKLRKEYTWPQRMLLIGLPVAIALGAATSAWVLGVSLGVALLLGVVLAPTDAALAEPVVSMEELPIKIRQSVNVESGLNDGLALPGLFIAVSLIETEEGMGPLEAVLLLVRELGFGVAGGIVFGLAGAWLVGRGAADGWMNRAYLKIATVALGLAAFGATQVVGGSGFVAAFVGGLVFAAGCRRLKDVGLFDFAHHEASALVMIAFLFFGIGPARVILSDPPTAEVWFLALLSLLVIRPISIFVSLAGQRLGLGTKAFFAWFGPRGLATIVFLLTAAEEVSVESPLVYEVVMTTVLLSVLLHGLTAYPASKRLAHTLQEQGGEPLPELESGSEMPIRAAIRRSLRRP